MERKIFVNLPVKDLSLSRRFFEALGFTCNIQFTDDKAACMVISDAIHVMLLTHEKFSQFTPKALSDAQTTTEVLLCLSCDNREEVDSLVQKAVENGGATYNDAQDHGFMYAHGFQDPDGHIWELVYMNAGG